MSKAARSYLFVPGNRPERFDKAIASGADVVILDLEDAVAPNDKEAARAAVGGWLAAEKQVALRINGATTPWFAADLGLCRQPGVAAVLLPKAEHPNEIRAVTQALAHNGRAQKEAAVLPIIETALGMSRVDGLADTPGVARLVFGTLDFRVDLGIVDDNSAAGDEEELAFFRSRLVLASRLAQLQPPVDGVTTVLDDVARIEADTRRARRFGFGAKLCIHPKQIPIVHRAFAPSAAQIDWARRVLAAVQASGGSAVQVDGKMVDQPVILQAHAVLARAGEGE
ncbi:MAG TPA: CoA ester lyase [Burkholderiaceae bacterium]|nr:CoA ester lyase [Burkholderiaceae bacterium]